MDELRLSPYKKETVKVWVDVMLNATSHSFKSRDLHDFHWRQNTGHDEGEHDRVRYMIERKI